MSATASKPKRILFLDDDPVFLQQAREMFGALARGAWDIHLAQNHAQALAALSEQHMDLIVLDLGMPVVDGVQFLRLLNRAHPGQPVVVLTGLADDARRRECQELGALMIFEKPAEPGGYESLFAAMDALVVAPAAGFRGMVRSLGLDEVLQMKCLGRKSAVLEITTSRVRGRIYLENGAIIHAEQGSLQGEVALYSLLALHGGEFNLRQFAPPARRTINGQWEFLLMEAARLRDENAASARTPAPEPAPATNAEPDAPPAPEPDGHSEAHIEEVLVCSGAGEVLFESRCHSLETSLALLRQIEEEAGRLAGLLPVGRLDRVEIYSAGGRVLAQIRPDRRLLVRNSGGEA